MQKTLDSFLAAYKNHRIAVYGTGLNAKRVLTDVIGYDFCCVISNESDWIGKVYFGKKVLSIEEAFPLFDILLIAAIPSATRIIYERVKNIVSDQKIIFDLSGKQLNAPQYYRDNEYWNKRTEDLLSAIDEHEVISFDVFNTLISRKVLYPRNVFEIVAESVGNDKFLDWRISAEKELLDEGKQPKLYEIYNRISDREGVPKQDTQVWMNAEILTERSLANRREDVYAFFKYALLKKKKVFVVSDMYLSKDVIDNILFDCGIEGYQDLIVSCEEGCNKSSGELFEILKEKAGTYNILHIGDDEEADCKGAETAGIDSFHLLGNLDILLASSSAHIVSKVNGVWDELLLGHILTHLNSFADPFEMGKHMGKNSIKSLEELTILCFVPITMCYMSWIVEKLQGKQNDIVFFASRDGYLLEKIYHIVKKEHPELKLPDSVYFYTSRRAMADIIPINEDGIKALTFNLDQYRKIDIVSHIEKVFGITFEGNVRRFEGSCVDEIGKQEIIEALLSESPRIVEHAKEARVKYQKYIDRLNIEKYENVYLVDLVAQGSSRYGLSSILGKNVRMLALGTTKLPNPFVPDIVFADSLYGQMVTGIGSAVSVMFNLLELVYGSREGQLAGFNEEGFPKFYSGTEYNVELLDTVQETILSFLDNYWDKKWYCNGCTREFAEQMLGLLDSRYSSVSSDVRSCFEFNDPLDEASGSYNVLDRVSGYDAGK